MLCYFDSQLCNLLIGHIGKRQAAVAAVETHPYSMYYNKDRGAVCKSIRGFWPSTGIGPQKKDTPPKISAHVVRLDLVAVAKAP